MEISSDLAGTAIEPVTFTASARHIMNYAAAALDPNPRYLDDERPDGLIAPPMYPAALTWRISRDLPDRLNAGPEFAAMAQRQVHYTEHIRWRRPIRPGDEITITGEVTAVAPHRAGAIFAMRYTGSRGGETVFEEVSSALLRDVRCTDDGKGQDALPHQKVDFAELKRRFATAIPVGPLAAHIYDGCADIHFPIHTSPRFARAAGLPGPILHGTAMLAYAVREIVDRLLEGDAGQVESVQGKFTDMIPLNVNCVLDVYEVQDAKGGGAAFTVTAGGPRPAISDGLVRFNDRQTT